ncbi:MAG: NFACT RNA binding domain-containing protein [Candidatus Eisenbacteria bacterium]
MDTTTARRLIAEIAPRVAGARVADVVAHGADCLLLELASERRVFLGAVTMKALPILFLLDGPGPAPGPGHAPAPPFVSQLRGSVLVSLAQLEDRPGAVAHLQWTSQVGRTIERWLTIDLGRSPSLVLSDARRAHDPVAPEVGASAPTVARWHDERGRLHARLSSENRNEPAEETRGFETLNAAACFMFTELWPELDLARRREAVEKVIERCLKRTRRAMDKVQVEIDDSENATRYRHMGQLLLMHQAEIARGARSHTLTDYDGSTPVVIELDPTLGPRQNAEAFFRRARKAERRGERAPSRMGELEGKAAEFLEAADRLATASADEIVAIEERFLRAPPKVSDRKVPKERVRFRTYRISGGWEVLVGKSNNDNDLLTHKMAKSDDLWFHARQVAGSHVVLRKSGHKAEPDRQAILEAAAIAAFHSKAGKSSKVSVCYTEKRHVRKARGGKPGLAVVAREKVVIVRPKLPDS